MSVEALSNYSELITDVLNDINQKVYWHHHEWETLDEETVLESILQALSNKYKSQLSLQTKNIIILNTSKDSIPKPITDQFGGYANLGDALQATNIITKGLEGQIQNMHNTCAKAILCKNEPNDHNVGFFTYVTGAICAGVGIAISPVAPTVGSSLIGIGMGLMAEGVAMSGEETTRRKREGEE